jgi:hypothetical protein
VATPHLLVPARAAFADLAVPETPAAEPALAETALVSAVAPWPALEVTSSGEVFPALQQSISAASAETAIAEALIDLRLPGSPLAEPAAAPGQAPAIRFVSIPVVQQVTETAVETGAARPELVLGAAPAALPTAAPAALASPAPAKATAPAKAAPAALARPEQPQPRMASAFAPAAKAKAMTAPVGKAGPGYTVTNGTIDFALATRINGQPAGALPLRVTPDDRLWLRMRDLLLLVRERMNPLEFDRIAMSSSLEDYVEFDTVRRAGIALRYDAARNQIDLGVN